MSHSHNEITIPHHHEHEHSHDHGHGHHHGHGKCKGHGKGHGKGHEGKGCCKHKKICHGKIFVLRPQSGISGDMLLSGLAKLTNTNNAELLALVGKLNLPVQDLIVEVHQEVLNGITGYKAKIELPHEHAHRTLADITHIINNSDMTDKAKEYAISAFTYLAEAEAKVHDTSADKIHFHEVGALDSIIDTCLCAMLFDKLEPNHFICGPLPVADGSVKCAHGVLSTPAPAVLHLLHGMKITSSNGSGEMLTPTAISLLKAFNVEFGNWAEMTLEDHYIIYGSRIIPNIPNGAIFAVGKY